MKLRQAWELIEAKPARMIVFVVVTTLLIIALIPTAITWAPHWLASTSGLNASQRADEVGRVRTALLAVLAGAVAVVGAIYTARTFGLNRQGQVTERFTRAVDQLGNDSLDVRVGGIYALERLARESPDDHGPVVEVLTAYIRERARRIPTDDISCDTEGPADVSTPADAQEERTRQQPSGVVTTDVQAILTVIGRRKIYDADPPLRLPSTVLIRADLREASLQGAYLAGANLRAADLAEANLWEANLAGANLREANLSGANLLAAILTAAGLQEANLYEANLQNAYLSGTNLQEANLGDANLQAAILTAAKLQEANLYGANLQESSLRGAGLEGADLTSAHLEGAELQEANLKGAELQGANLYGANLQEANLQEANLSEANLSEANLHGADLDGALYGPDTTTWPNGFDYGNTGAIPQT